MSELRKLAQFKNLRSATFAGTKLDDTGLKLVCDVETIENLNLQNSAISNSGISELTRLPRLASLRIKENPQLTNDCIPFLLEQRKLVELQIQETGIDQDGLNKLVVLSGLKDICIEVWDDNFTCDGLIQLSRQMPDCTILAKGVGEFVDGELSS